MRKNYKTKRCNQCGYELERIVYTGNLSEEWNWNGDNWECVGFNSLLDDPEQMVRCPECDSVVGKGTDFGFVKRTGSYQNER